MRIQPSIAVISCMLKPSSRKLGGFSSFATKSKSNFPNLTISSCVFEMKGARPYMEDRHIVGFDNKLAAVFDGHGGDKVAIELHQKFIPEFSEMVKTKSTPLGNAGVIDSIGFTFDSIDKFVSSQIKKYFGNGAAASLSYINFDEHTNSVQPTIITANVGDSRVVLSQNKKAIELTEDHKPNLPRERERIEALGGSVKKVQGCYRVQGNLALSRAIGDEYLKPYVCATPEFREHTITPEDEFVIVATDGVWDMFKSQDAVDFVHHTIKVIDDFTADPVKLETLYPHVGEERDPAKINAMLRSTIAEALGQEAYRRDKRTSDNISVIIQWINHKK